MSKLSTLGAVRETITEVAKDHWDDLVPVKDMQFDSLGIMLIGSEEHRLRPHAQRLISNRLGVPYTYLDRCPDDVQAYNLNHWINQERNEKLFVRFSGDEVRAVFTPRYTPLDHVTVLDKLYEMGYPNEQPVQYSLDDEFLMLNLMEKEKSFLVQKGDRLTPGISVGNSEVGLSSLTLAAFILRLVCTNGLISQSTVESSYRHVSERILNEFPQVIERLGHDLDRNRERFRISLETQVKDPDATLRTFNRQFQLNEKETEAVDWGWLQERGETMFNVVNSYTKASQAPKLPAESSYKLQRVGGSILALLN